MSSVRAGARHAAPCASAAPGRTMPASARARMIKSSLRERMMVCRREGSGARATMYAPRTFPHVLGDDRPRIHGLARWRGPSVRCTLHPCDRLSLDMTPTMRFLRPTARLLASLVAQGAPAAGAPGTVAFVDVSLIPMTGTAPSVLPNRTVIVRDGRIAQIGATGSLTPPAGATVIQGSGKYLMPGLAEMHAHLPGANAPAQLAHDILFLYVANGITTIRGMLGAPSQLDLRRQTASGELLGPTIL